jgi:hypothetical protein
MDFEDIEARAEFTSTLPRGRLPARVVEYIRGHSFGSSRDPTVDPEAVEFNVIGIDYCSLAYSALACR